MKKDPAAMTDRELLEELVHSKRRDNTMRKVKTIIFCMVLILAATLCYRYLPPAIAYMKEMSSTIQQAIDTMNQIMANMKQITDTTNMVRDTISNWDQSSIETLKEAGDTLNEVLNRIPPMFR